MSAVLRHLPLHRACVCQLELDAALSRIMPPQLTKYFYCNSGSEAVDNAVKIARAATGRECIIAFDVSGCISGRQTAT
jgi:4-aminobutyrate aminotransferase-like enzyme